MNEIDEMREAFDRAETNLARLRWIVCHPLDAVYALQLALSKHGPKPRATDVTAEIDRARNQR
jgi:hypothetical protein